MILHLHTPWEKKMDQLLKENNMVFTLSKMKKSQIWTFDEVLIIQEGSILSRIYLYTEKKKKEKTEN